jgi:hypothetical protein
VNISHLSDDALARRDRLRVGNVRVVNLGAATPAATMGTDREHRPKTRHCGVAMATAWKAVAFALLAKRGTCNRHATGKEHGHNT